jgi:aminopeptidase N
MPAATPPALRTPGDVKPLRESLELTLDPAATKAPGRVVIAATVVRPTRVVWVNATNLAIDHATLNGAAATVLPFKPDEDFIGLAAPADLAPGPLSIEIAFTSGIDHEKSRGLYSVTEQDGTPYLYTFFESVDARRAFPCFDEPSAKIPWTLTLHVKATDVAAANAPVASEKTEGAMKTVTFAETKPLPSYLVAFVAGPFEVIDDGVAGRAKTPIHFIVPKGRSAELAWAKEVTPKVVAAEEDYFDMDYPFVKLDVAVVPRYWGTMEHPGIVAMGQPLSLIPPDKQTEERKRFYANILAHELGHYWFGDYVTLAWWDDTWLNESFGEWFDMIITDEVGPQWQYRDQRVDLALGAMHSDEALAVNAIHVPITTRQAIESTFDGEITYSKGASVLRMFEDFVTPEQWQKFIREYLRAHAYANANAHDLYAAAETSLGAPVAAGLRSFFDQPGVPRIAIIVACKAGTPPMATITQTRSLAEGVTDPQPKLWTVPVCFQTSESPRTCALISQAETKVPLSTKCPAWVIPNAGAYGYYRSAISPATLAAVMKPGTWNRLDRLERVMLLADVSASVNRGEIPRDQVMALAPKLAADKDDRVASMGAALSYFTDDALDDALHDKLVAWQLSFMAPRARALGWKRKPGDTEAHQELRRELVGDAAFHDPVVSKEAKALAAQWLKDRTGIDDDIANMALAAATYHGDAAWFDALLAAARAPRDRTDQGRILHAFGWFSDPALAKRALDLPLGKEFDLRESIGIVEGMMQRRETRDLALAWAQAHTDEILARMRADEAMWYLTSVAGAFCDRTRVDAVKALLVPRAPKIDGAELGVKRALEASETCIANTTRQLPRVRALLHAK